MEYRRIIEPVFPIKNIYSLKKLSFRYQFWKQLLIHENRTSYKRIMLKNWFYLFTFLKVGKNQVSIETNRNTFTYTVLHICVTKLKEYCISGAHQLPQVRVKTKQLMCIQ